MQKGSVVYDFQERNADAPFDVFVAPGIDEQISIPGWFDSRPSRVYTCYRIEVSFQAGTLEDFHRSVGEDALACPSELVSALGDGAQYREPQVFDG